MKSRVDGASTASAAATAWAENLGGGADGDHGRPGRQTCWAVWREDLAAFEVLQPRGDSLRSMGTTWRGRTMLHAEEGMWLVERGMLAVRPFSGPGTPRAPAATPSPATGDDANEDHGQVGSRSLRPKMVEETGEYHQGRQEKEDNTAHERIIGASVGCSTGGGEERQQKKEETDPLPWGSADEASPSQAGLSSKRRFSGKKAPDGKPEAEPDSRDSRGLARAEEQGGHGRRRRGGCKRGRPGSSGSERDGRPAPALSMSVEDLHGLVLPRAGVPWECYRAYAELKRRSYVVRRQPGDTVGHDDTTPRAAALSWFQPAPAAARHPKTVNPKTNNGSRTGTDTGTDLNNTQENCSSSSSSSSSSPSSSLPPYFAGPSHLPVTFHVYNNKPPGSSSSSSSPSFRKRDPGPPDALLAVCRFRDPMPDHGSLVALAERHAGMRKMSAGAGVSTGKPAERRREGEKGAAGTGSGLEQASSDRGSRGRGRTAAVEEEGGGRGADRPSGGEAGSPVREDYGLSGQRCGELAGEAESAPKLSPRGGGGGGGGRGVESRLGVPLRGTARGAGDRPVSLDQEHSGPAVAVGQSQAEEVLSLRKGGGSGGGRGGHVAGKGSEGAGLLLSAGERRTPPPPAPGLVKLAVVSWEAGVQLFDVGVHDASEAAEPLCAS